MDINQQSDRGGHKSFTKAGLTIGADVAKFNTAATVNYTIDGIMYNKGATANIAFSSGHTTLSNNQICTFAVWLDSDGNFSTTQSAVVSSAEVTGGITAVQMPDVVENKALVGLVKVKTAIATFIPGTTNLTATNVTNTYYDCSVIPTKRFTS